MKNVKGERMGIRGLLTDITPIREYEEELRRLNAELEAYAHTVSHDIKSPISLAAMAYGQTEAMLASMPGIEAKERETLDHFFRIGREGLERTLNLIDNILLLAEAGARKSVAPVDVAALVKMILAEKALTIQERKVRVEVDADLGSLVASPTNVYQVFANLIGNSLKHNTGDRPVLEIRLVEGEGAKKRYLVRDNGPGIPEEVLEEVFSPFAKGIETGGTGLGLAIVKKIVEADGGEVRAYNDGGACFEFTL